MLELEKEKLEQNDRMLMIALLRQGVGAPLPSQATDQEMTPVRGGRPAAVVDQAAAFRRVTEENASSTQPNQARPGVVVKQAAAVSGPGGQLKHTGVEMAGVDITELARRNQVTEEALRDGKGSCCIQRQGGTRKWLG